MKREKTDTDLNIRKIILTKDFILFTLHVTVLNWTVSTNKITIVGLSCHCISCFICRQLCETEVLLRDVKFIVIFVNLCCFDFPAPAEAGRGMEGSQILE